MPLIDKLMESCDDSENELIIPVHDGGVTIPVSGDDASDFD